MTFRRRLPALRPAAGAGFSLPELSVVLALVGLGVVLSVPALSRTLQRERLGAALRDIATDLGGARWRALVTGRGAGLRFQPGPGGDLVWQMHADGDGDGLRTADVRDGTDPAAGRPTRLAGRHPGVRAGVLPGIAVPRLPPQRGRLSAPDDPVKFGSSDLATFAPEGGARSGSLYLTDGSRMVALVVNGITGRVRLYRFVPDGATWKEFH